MLAQFSSLRSHAPPSRQRRTGLDATAQVEDLLA
jgi:hypothetical protein